MKSEEEIKDRVFYFESEIKKYNAERKKLRPIKDGGRIEVIEIEKDFLMTKINQLLWVLE